MYAREDLSTFKTLILVDIVNLEPGFPMRWIIFNNDELVNEIESTSHLLKQMNVSSQSVALFAFGKAGMYSGHSPWRTFATGVSVSLSSSSLLESS
jgi:hypothetical protein